jgi:hypothetical protein
VAFYLLLIVPHIVALGGLFAFAAQTRDGQGSAEDDGEAGGGGDGGTLVPRDPKARPPGGGLPLADGRPPRRRLRVGERLAELYPRRLRRGDERHPPRPLPAPARGPAHR